VTVTTISSHCSDGWIDQGETDLDCGGPCDPCVDDLACKHNYDCVSRYCSSGYCKTPSCNDGLMNGLETGLDCGGGCPACICWENWDCALDGSENCSANQCLQSSCSSECTDLKWRSVIGSTVTVYYRPRVCDTDLCRFVSSNTSSGNGTSNQTGATGVYLDIIPKSPYIWLESGRSVYVSNCEEKTNYFSVNTNVPSMKWYQFIDPGFYAPSVAVSPYLAWDTAKQTSSNGYLNELCEIPAAYDFIYSRPCFQAAAGASAQIQCIYTLTYRTAFRVSASAAYNQTGILLNLTRSGSCYYRNGGTDSWSVINAVPSALFIWDTDSKTSYKIKCNSTYGESATAEYGYKTQMRGFMRTFAIFIYDAIIATPLAYVWYLIFGFEFEWAGWMILLIIPIILVGCFLLISVLFVFNSRRQRNKGPA
jgi:hypothetical protein